MNIYFKTQMFLQKIIMIYWEILFKFHNFLSNFYRKMQVWNWKPKSCAKYYISKCRYWKDLSIAPTSFKNEHTVFEIFGHMWGMDYRGILAYFPCDKNYGRWLFHLFVHFYAIWTIFDQIRPFVKIFFSMSAFFLF
jgi:hypothetical protein